MLTNIAGYRVGGDVKLYRSLVEVIAIDYENVYCRIPAWQNLCAVAINRTFIPKSILEKMRLDFYLYARVNIGEDEIENLVVTDWELSTLFQVNDRVVVAVCDNYERKGTIFHIKIDRSTLEPEEIIVKTDDGGTLYCKESDLTLL